MHGVVSQRHLRFLSPSTSGLDRSANPAICPLRSRFSRVDFLADFWQLFVCRCARILLYECSKATCDDHRRFRFPSGAARDKVVADSVYCEANTTSNYVTHPNHIRIRRLVAFRGGIVLDPFDFVEDVYHHGFGDQILAIFDEPTPVVSQVTPSSSSSASSPSSSTAHVVEVTNLSAPPQGGLRVDPPAKAAVAPTPAMSSSTSSSSSSQRKYVRNQNGRKSTDSSVPSRSVTLSPEIEKREMSHSKDADSSSTIKRTDARKSRISEGFFDRFEELAVSAPHPSPSAKPRSSLSGLIQSAANPNQTVVVLNKVGSSKEIGIEISAVPHPTNSDRLQAVEILRIDPEGRVAEDGRLKVGDHLVEINERPIYQMSLARVRAYLHELAAITAPTVTVDRPMESFALQDKPDKPVEIKPITSALQQANTKQIGATSTVTIVKGSTNLGFTITSRETAGSDGNMERLFYVGSVKTDGPAFGNLKRGDRLLEVAGQNIAGLNQPDVVALLKAIPQGDGIDLLISRIGSSSDDSAVPTSTSTPVAVMCTSQTAPNLSTPKPTEEFRLPPSPIRRTPSEDNPRTLEFEIPVNDTGSAGLGISLKARATIRPDKSRIDRGIFVKNILTGGAAYKDGRLTISDQIVGIEDVDLTQLKNAQANEAITECLKRLGPNAKTVTLRVRREPLVPVNPNTSSLEISDCTAASISVASTSFLPSPQPAPVASRQNSAFADDAQSEVSSLAGDHFARDNVTRRSVSEKRHIGAANDPSHIQIFQKIKHQRQTSAPPGSMQTSASFTGGIGNSSAKRGESSSANRRHSRSFNAASRARNSSVGLLALASTPEVSVDPVAVEKPVVEFADIPDEEPTASLTSNALLLTDKFNEETLGECGEHLDQEAIGYARSSRDGRKRGSLRETQGRVQGTPESVARRMAKEKQQRRKSIGSTFFSKKWFSLGSKSRDTSPEKPSTSSKHNGEPRKSPDNFVARAKKAMSPPSIDTRSSWNTAAFPRTTVTTRSTQETNLRSARHRSQIYPHHRWEETDTATQAASLLQGPTRRPTSIITTEPRIGPGRSPTILRPSSSALADPSSPGLRLLPLRTSTPLPSQHQWPPPAPTTTTPSTHGSPSADTRTGRQPSRLVTSATDPAFHTSSSPSRLRHNQELDTAMEHRRSRPLEEPSTIQYRRALQWDNHPAERLRTPTERPPELPPPNMATSYGTAHPFTSAVSSPNPRMSLRARKQRAAGIRVFDVDKNEKPPILMRVKSDSRPISPSDIHVETDFDRVVASQVPLRREAFRFSNRRESESRSKSIQERHGQRSRRRPTSEVLVFNENESPPAYC
ncbi:hypothetical protein L596_023445 [Steinernema carpocapsae]|uniref:PDZ domain-containing protein n=1 Tax=Steinernema carpocapsae TaxID=34508 RepID=A0A4U5MDN1_STECR|nr:hypothetical protein L596_023445 [Steinernema carpocapsae]